MRTCTPDVRNNVRRMLIRTIESANKNIAASGEVDLRVCEESLVPSDSAPARSGVGSRAAGA
ncbi:MAG: hypothetical protein E6G34_06405 [Actinobacteria bacterium]|nr:MAG: hypothetical protein E6G34_06405 [Actinomycetota bacterium]